MATKPIPALDLNTAFPRSPRAKLGGYVVVGRTLDKCRATLVGKQGEYHFDCPLDRQFFDFTGISSDDFKAYVATGASDEEVAVGIQEHANPHSQEVIIQWNNDLRYKPINEMPIELQVFLESYIPEFVPEDKIVYVWFDVYDIEEGRI